MYIVRDIFHLRYGHYREAKALMDEALKNGMLPVTKSNRALSDFTGDAYRLIFESGYDTLADFENEMAKDMPRAEWQAWYARFKEHVQSGHREILKVVV